MAARTRRSVGVIGDNEILAPAPETTPTSCLGALLVDGVNAVPLARDAGGGRVANVEAAMLLLIADEGRFRRALVEVKDRSNHPWYAGVEALRQLRPFSESCA